MAEINGRPHFSYRFDHESDEMISVFNFETLRPDNLRTLSDAS